MRVRGCGGEAWGQRPGAADRDGQHGQGRDHGFHMQALQQDEPLRDTHLRGGGREDEARREDKYLLADHGKYE